MFGLRNFYPEEGVSIFLENADTHPLDYVMSSSRRLKNESIATRKPQSRTKEDCVCVCVHALAQLFEHNGMLIQYTVFEFTRLMEVVVLVHVPARL